MDRLIRFKRLGLDMLSSVKQQRWQLTACRHMIPVSLLSVFLITLASSIVNEYKTPLCYKHIYHVYFVCVDIGSKGYFHSTMLMQALRKGFLSVKRKRDLAGLGLPPVACSFFSFSLCFLFSSSSFMMTGLAASALEAILIPQVEKSFQISENSHSKIPKSGAV